MRIHIDFFNPTIIPRFVRAELRDRVVPELVWPLPQPPTHIVFKTGERAPTLFWATPPQEYHPDDWPDCMTKRYEDDLRNMENPVAPVATSIAALKKMLTIIEDLFWHHQGPREEQEQALKDYLRKAIREKEPQNEVWRKQVTELRDREGAAITHPSLQTGGRQASELSEVNKTHFGDRMWKNLNLASSHQAQIAAGWGSYFADSDYGSPNPNLMWPQNPAPEQSRGVSSEDLNWLSDHLSSHARATEMVASGKEKRIVDAFMDFLSRRAIPAQKQQDQKRLDEWTRGPMPDIDLLTSCIYDEPPQWLPPWPQAYPYLLEGEDDVAALKRQLDQTIEDRDAIEKLYNETENELCHVRDRNERINFCLKRFWARDLLMPKDPAADK
jgi:hypothetical protein